MKNQFSILLLLLLSATIFAQKEVQDPEAEPWLNQVSTLFSGEKTLRMDFSYKREDQKSGEKINGDGTLYMNNQKYRVEVDDFIIYFDGEKQYSQNTEAEEVYVSIPDPEDTDNLFSDPVRLLKNYKENFKYRVIGETDFNNKKAEEIQLYPIDINGPYALVKLFMNPDNKQLTGIVIRHKEGIIYSMLPGEIKRNLDKPEEFFRFNPADYPGFDLIDLFE